MSQASRPGKTLKVFGVLERVYKYQYPVAFDFPVGHQKENYALKIGADYELTVEEKWTTLREL